MKHGYENLMKITKKPIGISKTDITKDKNIKKEKVLFYTTLPVKLSFIRSDINTYTMQNGEYPDYIDMPEHVYEELQHDVFPSGGIKTLYGIKVREVKS